MKKRRRLKKGLAIVLTAAMVVGLLPGVGTLQVSATESDENTVNTVSSNEAMTPEPTPEQTDGQAADKLITAWQWIDEEEILDEETGNLALPGANEQTPAYFEDVTAFLPTQIQATVEDDSENPETGVEETITLGDWSCDNYPEEGAYSGSYTFTATLPEEYILSEETKELTIAVELGGATLYAAAWTYPTTTPTLTWTGSGTAQDPYIITTAQQLADMSYMVNAGLKNSDGKNYYELCYKLGADIDIGGKQWVPIGGIKNGTSYSYVFKGSFDGDNHTISNLTFSAVNTNYETLGRSGLFYEISGNAEIKNVKLENVDISMKGVSGALVATISGGYTTFSNCHVLSGTITSTSTVMQYFGGLIGGSFSNNNQSSITITNCTNRATVTGSSQYNDSVGGIIGYTRYGEINISNCYNYGTLSSKFYVGGIVGYATNNNANTTISNCGNEGTINSQSYTGGIVGIALIPDETDLGHRFTISGCYNKGAITSTNSSRAGGIVGCVGNKSYLYLIIERCYNVGTVTSDIYGLYYDDNESKKYGTQAVSVKNCVYIGDKVAYFGTGDNDAFNRKVTAEELASGKATVYLNQGLSEENLIWYQNLSDPDKDNYPVTDSTHSKVYASGYCVESATFSNTAPETIANNHVLEHVAQVDAKCGISGLKGHYKCRNCGELFSDENGTKIVTLVDLVIQPTATDHNYVDGICSVCGDFKTPTQNEEGYYLIYTLGELISYADMASPNDGEVWMPIEEPTAVSQKVRLMADIDMSSVYNAETGKSWEPIGGGNGDGYFKGDFDGNGHTISGLYINSTTVKYAGLFGRLMFGVCCVHDLTLKDVSINAPNATAAGAVAGFVDSYKKSPTIKNCMVESGTIKGKDYVGGIAGKTSSGQLLSASEDGEIILIDSGYISVIQNCGNNAKVTAATYAGGLSGYGPVWIEDSYNTGTVTGTTSGQITGYLSANSRVNNCYYLGSSDTAFCVNSTDAENITNVAYKSTDEFANGGVAWLLNGKISENTEENPLAWYQKLGENGDAFPVLDKSRGIVYVKSFRCDGNAKECSNILVDDVPRDPHELEYCEAVAPKCDEDGHKACWKCKNCDTYFSNESGDTELSESVVIIPATNIHSFDKNGMCTTCGKVYEPAELIEGVYQIKNAGNLAWFATLVNGDTYDKNGNIVERNVHANAVVLEDIDLSVICGPEKGSWVPIGSVSTPQYDGHFDGNYHTISNLYFNNTIAANVDSGGGKYAALFAYTTTGAVIENIIMTNVDITGFQYVGAVVGKNEYSTVKNCMVLSGSVKGTKGNVATGYNYGSGAGGIVGFGAGHIENCANFATVDGGSQVGGIVGTVYSRKSSDCTIVNCYNAGTVTGKLNVGEIVGQTAYYSSPTTDLSVAAARCDVKNCYYTGVNAAVGLFQSKISVQAYSVTEQQLATGEVTYRLNGSLSADELVWYQKLGENGDAYPVLKKNEQNDNTVYQLTCVGNVAYTNDSTLSGAEIQNHDFSAKDGICKICGYVCDHSDGYENEACKMCGKAQGVTFDTHSITLADEIGVNFMMILPENAKTENAYMEFSISGKNGKTTNVSYSEAIAMSDGRYKFTCLVNSIQMADTITATYHFGENETVTEEYSVKKYIEDIVASDTMDDTTKNLVKSLADYGYYAQLCLSETNGWTIGTDHEQMIHYTDAVDTTVDLSTYAYSQTGEVSGITKVNKSLVLDSKTAIRLLFTVDDTYGKKPVIAVKDANDNMVETQLTKQSDGRYCLLIPGISAHKLGETYTIVVDDVMTIRMSALTYAHGVLQSDAMTAATKQAVAALNAYYNAAIEYKNKQ